MQDVIENALARSVREGEAFGVMSVHLPDLAVIAEADNGGTFFHPFSAPDATFLAPVYSSLTYGFRDDFEALIAQRLLRTLCNDCKEVYQPDDLAFKSIGMDPELYKDRRVYRARGCENCFHTGYKGRNAIFEIMVLNEELRSLLLKSYDSNVIKKRALEMNMLSLRQDGIQKLLNGVTTIEEVFRVTMK